MNKRVEINGRTMEREKQKSVVSRFPRMRCRVDAILGRSVGAQGCITVELRIPERKHGMAKNESGQRKEEAREEIRMDGLTPHAGC